MSVVIDNSVFMAWCMGKEDDPTVYNTMRRVADEGGVVPRIWWYELRNALLFNERRGRITQQQVSDTLANSQEFDISIDNEHDDALILDLACRFKLTVYNSAYLEVALRPSLPIATLDKRFREAAE